MNDELDGRLLALRQTLAVAIALATRGHEQATTMALELIEDLRTHVDDTPPDGPFEIPAWASAAREEFDHIAHMVRAFSRMPPASDDGA
ncbi:hypothetical protein CEK29_07700 [Bordetella genomosp. 5]|uniref:Uncharacterized protein n=1 Tax=Bordetella genomosp. 5 TaxID=1395608 RepID=A0A261TW30_9BORD|nr:hypothetical protein [Bordetella genomosp. 5]OZI44593.1 hypothetical protein CEK29_07700 [Bordetella genomosp. 5]OZI53491.1 hypothetical protein CAL25_05790 [Bordetella genomosp. 5]